MPANPAAAAALRNLCLDKDRGHPPPSIIHTCVAITPSTPAIATRRFASVLAACDREVIEPTGSMTTTATPEAKMAAQQQAPASRSSRPRRRVPVPAGPRYLWRPLDLCLHRRPSLHHPHSPVVDLTTPSAPLEVLPPLSPVALASCGPKSTPVIILVVCNLVL
uniref:Uncharacterized protein n=1 Tax=Zea mays TaxID=4577 RepID=A0A804PW52_MAIZE